MRQEHGTVFVPAADRRPGVYRTDAITLFPHSASVFVRSRGRPDPGVHPGQVRVRREILPGVLLEGLRGVLSATGK